MKKLYALVACMLVASFCFAQIAPKQAHSFDGKRMIAPTMKHQLNAKSGAAEGWLYYPAVLENYWGVETTLEAYPMQYDSLGYFGSESKSYWHPNVHGWCQTFDFLGITDEDGILHNIYEEGSIEGDMSFLHTPSFTIDSIVILGGYFRGANVPSTMKDTIIIGFLTDMTEDDLMGLTVGGEPFMSFYPIEYDMATGVQANAVVYKFPIGEENVSLEEDDSYYSADLQFPINLTNVTGKVWNVAYTFKQGYNVDATSILYGDDNSYFYAWLRKDPRAGYSPFDASGSPVTFADHLTNVNMGGCADDDVRYNLTDPSSWAYGIYTPNPFWADFHYPFIELKVSCDACEFVGVEEMEKENITVCPNPATSSFRVNLVGSEKANIQLFNLVGQQVYSDVATDIATVNVSNLKAGVYMLKVSQNNKVYTSKVIVK